MTPKEFVDECCDPGYPVGYQYLLIEDQAVGDGWTYEQMVTAKNYAEQRNRNLGAFPFPKKVRYV